MELEFGVGVRGQESVKKVFIDGSAGTTGLRIRERLSSRADLELVVLPDEVRKDVSARRDALNSCDVAFLCLPDAAAIEAVSLVENPNTVVIDTSTAHRTSDGWEYGFPELAGRRAAIAKSKRIANPGCHASGFIALVEPLVRAGIVAKDEKLSAFSLTGYSGGGKKMIAQYEDELGASSGGAGDLPRPFHLLLGGRQYALGQSHKHLPEMVKVCGLAVAPCFSPIVVPHYSGMEVTVPLFDRDLAAIKACYREYYGEWGTYPPSEASRRRRCPSRGGNGKRGTGSGKRERRRDAPRGAQGSRCSRRNRGP